MNDVVILKLAQAIHRVFTGHYYGSMDNLFAPSWDDLSPEGRAKTIEAAYVVFEMLHKADADQKKALNEEIPF